MKKLKIWIMNLAIQKFGVEITEYVLNRENVRNAAISSNPSIRCDIRKKAYNCTITNTQALMNIKQTQAIENLKNLSGTYHEDQIRESQIKSFDGDNTEYRPPLFV